MSSEAAEPDDALLKARAQGVVNYLAMLQALARDFGMTSDDLVQWVQRPYVDAGYYETVAETRDGDRLRHAVAAFVHGRSLLYDASEVNRTDYGWEVRTPVWYVADPPESFFFFDVCADGFADYAHRLARSHARRLGIRLEIELADEVEIARFHETHPDGNAPAVTTAAGGAAPPPARRTAPDALAGRALRERAALDTASRDASPAARRGA
ncbi:hypothetical protein [Streptomyces sp. NPDC001500]